MHVPWSLPVALTHIGNYQYVWTSCMHIALNADAPLNPYEPYCKIYGKPFWQTCKEIAFFKFSWVSVIVMWSMIMTFITFLHLLLIGLNELFYSFKWVVQLAHSKLIIQTLVNIVRSPLGPIKAKNFVGQLSYYLKW
jgi:hypothetical protein